MKIIKIIPLILMTLLFVACSEDDYNANDEVTAAPEVTRLVVRGEGTVAGVSQTITHPLTGVNFESVCFTMDLVDPATNQVIGTLRDCDLGTEEFGDGTLISNVITTFIIENKGTITSVAEVLQTPIEGSGSYSTLFEPVNDNIVASSGSFSGAKGTVALDGDVDLSLFGSGIITFNCTFTIEYVQK